MSAVYATTTDVLPAVVTTTEISIETTAEPMTTSAATNDDAAIESVTPQSVEEVPPEAHDDQPNSENMESIQEAVVAQE